TVAGDRGLNRLALIREDEVGFRSQVREPRFFEPTIPGWIVAPLAAPFEVNHRVLREVARVSQLQLRAACRRERIGEQRFGLEPLVLTASIANRGIDRARTQVDGLVARVQT